MNRRELYFRHNPQMLIPVLRQNPIRPQDLTNQEDCATQEFSTPLEIVVRQKPAVAIALQPVIQVDLVEVRSYGFFSQFVSIGA